VKQIPLAQACRAAALFAAIFLAGAPVWAERADRDREANVSADHSTLDDLHQVEILTGHVVLVKGSMRLTGDRMEHRQDENGYQFYVVTAEGEDLATFHERRDPVRPDVELTLDGVAERIEYDDKSDRVTLIRRAQAKRFENGELRDELSGARIVYDARKSSYEVDGHNVDGSGDRVHMRIAPRNSGGSGAGPVTPPAQLQTERHAPATVP